MTEGRSSTKDQALPDIFFDAVAFFLPGLNDVAQRCGISIGEWAIMWHLRRAATRNTAGQAIMPRQSLTELLARVGFGDSNISRLLTALENKELIRRVSLTQRERQEFFGPTLPANRQAVILQPSGDRKIDEFQNKLTDIFAAWVSKQSLPTRKIILSASGIGLDLANRLTHRKVH